ncbi:hypothetical protein J6590_050899 [Homalodisca vitripennis]|nr:hypothetical protein J6590_050899 [Homalodisca vitripennis]
MANLASMHTANSASALAVYSALFTDLCPEIWNRVLMKRSKNSDEERRSSKRTTRIVATSETPDYKK